MKNSIEIFLNVALAFLLTMLIMLTGCHVTYVDPMYEDHPHTTEVYWPTDYEIGGLPYFGYWEGWYYYYGKAHFYPWWYYYQFIPPYYYYTHTHIYVHCDNGQYVYGHRDILINNNIEKHFYPTVRKKNIKEKSFVFPRNWKSSNSPRINKQNYNRTFNINQSINDLNKINIKSNANRNINKNTSNKNKINQNGNNNRKNRKPN